MALTKKVNFTRFSRFGANLGRLTYTAATHEDATDGTDELKIRCDEDLGKGERLVWVDRQGVVHEENSNKPVLKQPIGPMQKKTYSSAVLIKNSISMKYIQIYPIK